MQHPKESPLQITAPLGQGLGRVRGAELSWEAGGDGSCVGRGVAVPVTAPLGQGRVTGRSDPEQ